MYYFLVPNKSKKVRLSELEFDIQSSLRIATTQVESLRRAGLILLGSYDGFYKS